MNNKRDDVLYTEYEDRTRLLYTPHGNYKLHRHTGMMDDGREYDYVAIELWDEQAQRYKDIGTIANGEVNKL